MVLASLHLDYRCCTAERLAAPPGGKLMDVASRVPAQNSNSLLVQI